MWIYAAPVVEQPHVETDASREMTNMWAVYLARTVCVELLLVLQPYAVSSHTLMISQLSYCWQTGQADTTTTAAAAAAALFCCHNSHA